MKPFLYISLITLILFSCKKETKNQEMTVIKDCSGTYLRMEDKDYQVCNFEETDRFEENEVVMVSFRKIDTCEALEGAVCMLYHENEGLIKIIYIE